MSLKTFVKIGKVENLSDARYCAGMMVDILGFNIQEGTEGYIDPKKFEEITNWVAGVQLCGEFHEASSADIKLNAVKYQLDFLEIQNLNILEELSELNVKLIYKLCINEPAEIENLSKNIEVAKDLAEYIIIKCENSSLSHAIMKKLESINEKHNLIIGFNLTSDNISELASSDYLGIELEGTPEDRPGFKDYDTVMDILELLETA